MVDCQTVQPFPHFADKKTVHAPSSGFVRIGQPTIPPVCHSWAYVAPLADSLKGLDARGDDSRLFAATVKNNYLKSDEVVISELLRFTEDFLPGTKKGLTPN
jgi:hypothetical protein